MVERRRGRARGVARGRVGAAVTVLAVVVAGCGGGSDGPSADDGSTTSPPPTTERVTTTTERPSTTTTAPTTTTEPPPRIAPGDTVGVRCDGTEGMVEVFEVDPATEAAEPVSRTTVPGEIDCSARRTYSTDFSAALVTIEDPGDPQLHHIAVVDLATGAVTDLTQPRVTAGSFSATPLDEFSPGFLGGGGSPLSFGSDQVAFFRAAAEGPRVTKVSDPSADDPLDVGVPFAASPDRSDHAVCLFRDVAGHSEMLTVGAFFGAYRVADGGCGGVGVANPGGTLLLGDGSVWPAGTLPESSPYEQCSSDTYQDHELQAIGWVDRDRIGLFGAVRFDAQGQRSLSGTFIVATVGADGAVASCTDNLIPDNPNDLSSAMKPAEFLPARLRIDGSAVEFSAVGPDGDVKRYSLPISGGEPTDITAAPATAARDLLVFTA